MYNLASSCLIMLFRAYFVQKVCFCPFPSSLTKSESGGTVDASTATLQPLHTYFLA